MEKQLKDFTDLELAEISGQLYNNLMRVQSEIMSVNQEIGKRRPKEVAKEENKE